MQDFHHILFPVDFSERCHAVRPFVKQMVRQFSAKLTLDAFHTDSDRLVWGV